MKMKLPRFQKGLTPILIVVIVAAFLLVGGGAFYFATNLNKPVQIKEKASLTQDIFEDYRDSIKDISDHLQKKYNTDTLSLERELQKGKGLIKTAEETSSKLKPQVEKLTLSEVKEYKNKINEYIGKSEKLLTLEKESMKLLEGYIDPLKQYEELTVSLGGISNYIYSDPKRYTTAVGAAVEKENKIISSLEAISVEGEMKKYHEAFVKNLKSERDLLQQIMKAVEERDSNAIAASEKKYVESQQENTREFNRVADELEDKVKTTSKDCENLSDDIKKIYDNLKGKYNF
ncbi:hypothetical protein HYS93_00255 [Candidatus Daviesbacteria bacterium]|nr:hypothetical protein [Candidatus Daviesbacteria bacterium]